MRVGGSHFFVRRRKAMMEVISCELTWLVEFYWWVG